MNRIHIRDTKTTSAMLNRTHMIVYTLYISTDFPFCYSLVLKTTYIRFSLRECLGICRHDNEGKKGNNSMMNGFCMIRKEN